MDLLGYTILGTGFITFGAVCYYLKKAKKEETTWAVQRLRDEMNNDLKILSVVPTNLYVTLNGDEQKFLDGIKSSKMLDGIRDKYKRNELIHLWTSVPKGETRNELIVKQKRIEALLEKIEF